ncbi:cupin domain protein [Synechococcus sp. RS9909]|uniref:2OG-Fe(II)-dependent halogenase WelO5 family protein n=1 Tax=unclassified Synechococcus TaxID=2626047 RepID=UPI00006907DA|nr:MULTISPECIES: hypothetical protein [unclassified Synechococcus]EAQ70152.1 hypothetical protein RS9917_04935 [Synechococcus sp. RS9917]QNI78192.1 cupin domain protein [Synechococcus sp. RS9909]
MTPTLLQSVLAGELALRHDRPGWDHEAISTVCDELRSPQYQGAWANTPWGRTLPRSCVGTDPDRYRHNLQARPSQPCQRLDQLFFQPLCHWLEQRFELPVHPLRLADGTPLPGWALREMAPGGTIPDHCERDWNHCNLVETGRLTDTLFDPNLQMSFLYGLQAASGGGELEILANREQHDLAAGDLLLFNAGVHPHRIRPTLGPRSRVVLGGFLRLNQSRTTLHCYV